MRQRVFLTADTHWGHRGVCKFTKKDGEKIRPWDCPEKMNEDMSILWNETVGPNDKVYVLGDWCLNQRFNTYGQHLNGEKILIMGNHDIGPKDGFLQVFRDVRGYHSISGSVMSHIPLHPSQMFRFGFNIHGHLHTDIVCLENGEPDLRYYCVSVEQHGFKPVLLDKVLADLEERKEILKKLYPQSKAYNSKQGEEPNGNY